MAVQDFHKLQEGPSESAISCPGAMGEFGKKNKAKSTKGSSALFHKLEKGRSESAISCPAGLEDFGKNN